MNATVNHDTHVAHIEAVVARQRTFFETGATRPVAVRVAALRRLKKEMQKREKILLDALQADLNKSHFEGYMCELGLNLDELGYLADHVRAWSQPRRKPTPLPQFKSSSYELPEPYGVLFIIFCMIAIGGVCMLDEKDLQAIDQLMAHRMNIILESEISPKLNLLAKAIRNLYTAT